MRFNISCSGADIAENSKLAENFDDILDDLEYTLDILENLNSDLSDAVSDISDYMQSIKDKVKLLCNILLSSASDITIETE